MHAARIPERLWLADTTLRKAGFERPKIAVCGINPHAGEHGLFGHGEDEQKVLPGVERAQAEELARAAHEEICPYSRAVRGNVEVTVEVE